MPIRMEEADIDATARPHHNRFIKCFKVGLMVTPILATPLTLFGLTTLTAHADVPDNYSLVRTITGHNIPPSNNGGSWCSDINYFDRNTGKYYLADNNNRQVDVVDAKTHTLLAPIGKGEFAGLGNCAKGNYSAEGPTGIVAADDLNQLWVGDGNSTVKVFDLTNGALLKTISTKGMLRADEMAYNQKQHTILVTNPDEKDAHNNPAPYFSLIDAKNKSYIGSFHVAHATTLEQPQWNPADDRFYMSIPALDNSSDTEVVGINDDGEVAKTYSAGASCSPSGLAIDVTRQEAALGCFGSVEIMDLSDGSIDATIPQISQTDEVWYNTGDERYYFGSFNLNGPTYIGVVNASSHKYVTSIEINDPVEHAMAVDPRTNEVYVPVSHKGIEVFKQKE